jgi:hypothetical protein
MELFWELATENHDIGFAVRRQTEDGELNESPLTWRTLMASIVCPVAGTHILEWNNSFSWTKRKDLRYKYELGEVGSGESMSSSNNSNQSDGGMNAYFDKKDETEDTSFYHHFTSNYCYYCCYYLFVVIQIKSQP